MTNAYYPVPVPDSLGPIYGADDVRDALKDTIDTWAPYYLRMYSGRLVTAGKIGGRKQPPNPLPTFGTWVNEPEYRNITAGQPAAYLVTVATAEDTDREGNGLYIATFRSSVFLQVFGTTWQEAADLTSWYEKVVRWCVLQHRGLGGLAKSTTWMGNEYGGIEHSSTRTMGSCRMAFNVIVPNVIDASRGPKTVPENFTASQDETVETVTVNFSKAPITEPI